MKKFLRGHFISLILLITLFQYACPVFSVSAADFSSIQSKMYRDESFTEETYLFTPFDKIYITVDFRNLNPGSYHLTTDWKTPWGSLEHQSIHSFTIKKLTPSYRVFSWLHLWKNGQFKRMTSGEEFKKEFHGAWQVILYLNGKQVAKHRFNVQ